MGNIGPYSSPNANTFLPSIYSQNFSKNAEIADLELGVKILKNRN